MIPKVTRRIYTTTENREFNQRAKEWFYRTFPEFTPYRETKNRGYSLHARRWQDEYENLIINGKPATHWAFIQLESLMGRSFTVVGWTWGWSDETQWKRYNEEKWKISDDHLLARASIRRILLPYLVNLHSK